MTWHRRDRQGVAGLFPAPAGRQVVQQPCADTLLRVTAGGSRGVATDAAPTNPGMPAFGWRLDDRQISDVASYIRNSRGNQAPAATAEETTRSRGMLAAAPR